MLGDPMPRSSGRSRRERGQSLVEVALVLPVLLLLVVIALDFGRIFHANIAITNVAKEGALFGATNPRCDSSSRTGCADPNTVSWHITHEGNGLSDLSWTASCIRSGSTVAVTSCAVGDWYRVSATSRFEFLTPLVGEIVGGHLDLRASVDARVSNAAFDPNATPIPLPTPTPTPAPTPTAGPTATAGATPTATPMCTVPDFIGKKKNSAAGLWSGAGFTGTLTATTPPNGNYDITTQSIAAGASRACTSSITVGG
jgi:hypothetical protein